MLLISCLLFGKFFHYFSSFSYTLIISKINSLCFNILSADNLFEGDCDVDWKVFKIN
jgi:hypothetical protein